MIAIAGAKGGCGKSLTALGLGAAFARAGDSVVVVDTDRQLPDLHTMAGVDRRPALGDGKIDHVAQPVSQQAELSVVSAPVDSHLDLPEELVRLDEQSVRTIVDCPPGGGPDVVEPLSVADSAVIVTTDTAGSIEGAASTETICERLDVPVTGIVLNRAEQLPKSLAKALAAPVLGVVPDREQPLADPLVGRAYDRIAARLIGADGRHGEELLGTERLETGVVPLDEALGGGLPPGSVLALDARSETAARRFLERLTTARPALYLTSDRPAGTVNERLESIPRTADQPTVESLDDPLSELGDALEALPENGMVLLDSLAPFVAADDAEFLDALNLLVERVRTARATAVLHCPAESGSLQETTRQFADGTLELHVREETPTLTPATTALLESSRELRLDLDLAETDS